jgi:hypothetical protein
MCRSRHSTPRRPSTNAASTVYIQINPTLQAGLSVTSATVTMTPTDGSSPTVVTNITNYGYSLATTFQSGPETYVTTAALTLSNGQVINTSPVTFSME